MNSDSLTGNWKQFKGKIREMWGDLTDDELEKFKGQREQLEGMIQQKYGLAKDEVKRRFDEFNRVS